MKIISLDISDENILNEIVNTLKQGKVIVYPTDTLYGLGVNALDKAAVDKLFRVKKRPRVKPVSIIIKDIKMARRFAYIDARAEKILNALWPGPITVVLSRKDTLPSIVSGGKNTIGMRIPNSEFTKSLMNQADFPVTSTSVNVSGKELLRKTCEITKVFESEKYQPDLIIDAGVLPEVEASTIIDLTTSKPKILRVGPVKPKELLKILAI